MALDLRKRPSRSFAPSNLLILLVVLFSSLFAWVYTSKMDQVVVAPGVLVPDSETYLIQHLDGGIIRDILVSEGGQVTEGEILFKLDDTEVSSTVEELKQQVASLTIRIARLEAELNNSLEIKIPRYNVENWDQLLVAEQTLLDERVSFISSQVSTIEEQLEIHQAELEILEPLVEIEATPELQLLNVKSTIAKILHEKSKVIEEREQQIAEQLSESVLELATVEQVLKRAEKRLERTTIRAPTNGFINQIMVDTVGSVVEPGEPLLEIIPSGGGVIVEARVSTQDIAFIKVGMPARLKLLSYEFSIYGTLEANVVDISASTIPSDLPEEPPSFQVKLEISTQSRDIWVGKNLVLRPGMDLTAELEADQITVLSYIISPIYNSASALERL